MSTNATTELLSLDGVAAELNVSKSTVEKWVHDKDLASFKKGKNRLVSRESLTRFVLLNTVNPRRPDWLSAEVESRFVRQLREMVVLEVGKQVAERLGKHEMAFV